jgi:hypothetical protein
MRRTDTSFRDEHTEPLLRPAGRGGQRVVGLNFGEAFGRRRPEPAGVLEAQALEDEIADGLGGRAGPFDQRFDKRRLDVGRAQVFSSAWDVIEAAGGAVEIELAGRAKQLVGVFDVRRLFADARRTDQVGGALAARQHHALRGVVPAGLGHDDHGAVDGGDRTTGLGPAAETLLVLTPDGIAAGVDEFDV